MKVEQFEDKNLSHYSYAILSNSGEIVLVDPARDPEPYYKFAHEHEAKITGVIETHPHADFVSSHLEIHQQTGSKIFVSTMLNAEYSFIAFDEGGILEFGDVRLKVLNTPGHSPDSISVVLEHETRDKVVFTGDTLFIGDCGRPDLREKGQDVDLKREELSKKMYSSLRHKLMLLDDDVTVYPAHGAGTLCGKALSKANSSTIGAEKLTNWSLQEMSESEFVAALTVDQPFIPKYFSYDVDLNKKGAPVLDESLRKVSLGRKIDSAEQAAMLDPNVLIVDTRDSAVYKKQHLRNSINIMDGEKFETWLGTLVTPGEFFYLAGGDEEALIALIKRTAKIGYESFIKKAFLLDFGVEASDKLNLKEFKENPTAYTIVDIRSESEVKEKPVFADAINVPLPELNSRFSEIPTDKPVVVHCAGGYRSAAGSSLLDSKLDAEVYDLSDHIKEFYSEE